MPTLFKSKLLLQFLLTCAACASTVTAVGQTSKVEELKKQLREPMHDTARITVLKNLSKAYSSVDPVKKYEYALRYKEIAEELKMDSVVADAYLDIGVSYGIRSKPDSALYFFSMGYELSKKSNYPNGMGRSLANSGFAYDRLDDKQQAIRHYMGALKIFKKIKFVTGINQCYINIGSIYSDLQQHKLAESYFKLALNSYKAINDENGVAYAMYTLGNVTRESGKYAEAEEMFNKSLAVREKLGDFHGIALARMGLGRLQTTLKRHDEAIGNLEIALENTRKLQDTYVGCAVMASLAKAYMGKGDFGMAVKYGEESLISAKSIKSKIAMVEALEVLVEIYKLRKNIPRAFEYQSELIKVSESIEAEQIVKDLTLTEFERIRAENDDLTRDYTIASKKNTGYVTTILVTSVLLILAAALALLLYKRNKDKKTINNLLLEQKEKIAAANQELERLNSVKNKFFSIVSHDLRAPLANLKMLFGLYREGDLEESELRDLVTRLEDTIITTSSFLDNLLSWSKNQLEGIVIKPDNIDLKAMIDQNIHLYAPQVKTKNLHIDNQVMADQNAFADPNMINVVIRNILSNSIKFCRTGDSIKCVAVKQSNEIVLSISDNGPGISERDLITLFSLEHTMSTGNAGETGHRIGLVLCREMLEQNGGSIEVKSKAGQGSTFIIRLPAVNN